MGELIKPNPGTQPTLNATATKAAKAAGVVKSASVLASADGVLNWAGGEHTMTPTVDPDLIHPVTIDPASNKVPGVTGVDGDTDIGEYGHTMSQFHRK